MTTTANRAHSFDNLRTLLVFLVVVIHSGVVYESSGLMGPYWLVDDPSTTDAAGLLNLILELFVMPAFFFISGFFTPGSLTKTGAYGFLRTKLRRIVLPWGIALFTLMPLYKVIYLFSRGLPQEHWTRYFHFTNGALSMNWLWFLPVLFGFYCLYVLFHRVGLPLRKIPLGWALTGAVILSTGCGYLLGALGLEGWTKTWFFDVQNERLLPYLFSFLIGALAYKRGLFDTTKRNLKLYIGVSATAWLPINVYVFVLLNYLLHPGEPIFSPVVDGILYWSSLHISMLAMVYILLATFHYWARRTGRFARNLSALSYGVYLVHIPILGLLATALLNWDVSALIKYPLLFGATYLISNLLVLCYRIAWARFALGRARVTEKNERSFR
jgi:fucose 4-O-acetylase-like acetyltransferase